MKRYLPDSFFVLTLFALGLLLSLASAEARQTVATVVEDVTCRVLSVEAGQGKTRQVTIDRGQEDGLVVGWKGKVYSVYGKRAGRDYETIGTAEVARVEAQTAVVRVTLDKLIGKDDLMVGDAVEVRARVPQKPERSSLWQLARLHITLLDNARQPFNAYRELYAKESPAFAAGQTAKMVDAIHEVAEFIEGDINKELTQGRYAGKRVREVIEKAGEDDLRLFLKFVLSYPGKYIGGDWKLSETFATWVLNDAPASTLEIGDLLIAAKTKEERGKILEAHREVIIKDGMLAYWYSRAQDLSKERKFTEAHALADAVIEASGLPKQEAQRGWGYFAKAYAYSDAERYREAAETYQQAVAAFRTLKPPTDDARKGIAYSTHNRGFVLSKIGRLKEALSAYEEAWKQKNLVPAIPPESRVVSRQAIGEACFALSDYPHAIENFKQAAILSKPLSDTATYAGAMRWLATAYSRLSKNEEATRTYRDILALQKRENDRGGQAQTLITLGDHQWRNGRYPDALKTYEEAARLREELGDRKGLAEALNGIGRLHNNLGEHAAALEAHNRSLQLCREMEDRAGQARALKEIGDLLQKSGDGPRALTHYRDSLALRRTLEDRLGEADVLEQIGFIQNEQKEYLASLQSYSEAAELYKKAGAKESLARAIYNRGVCYENRNYLPAALREYREALAMRQAIGAKADEALTRSSIADLLRRQQDIPGALTQLDAALALAKKTGSRALMARIYQKRGHLRAERFEYAPALEAYTKALALFRDPAIRDKSQEGWTLAALAFTFESQGKFAEALRRYGEALRIAEETKERPLAANVLRSIGWLHRTLGEPEKALAAQQKSLALAEEMQSEVAIADALYALAALTSDFGDAKRAFEMAERARTLYEAQKNEFGMMIVANATGVYYYRQGDVEEARQRFERSLTLAEKIGAKRDICISLENLGETWFRVGEYDRAVKLLTRALSVGREIGDPLYVTSVRVTLSQCHRERGETLRKKKNEAGAKKAFAASEALLKQSIETLRASGAKGAVAAALREMGLVRLVRQDYKEAEKSLTESARLAQAMKSKHLLWETYRAQSRLHEARGNLRGAVETMRRAIAVIEDLKQGVAGGDKGLEKFLYSKIEIYEAMADLLGRLGAKEQDPVERKRLAEEALRYVGLARFQMLNQKAVNVAGTGDKKLDDASRDYREAVLRQGQLEREKSEAVAAGNSAKAAALEPILAKNDEEMVGNYVRLVEADPDFAARLKFDPRRISESATALPEKTSLLVCFPGQEALHLWVFDRSGLKVWRRVPISRAELYAKVQQFRAGIDQMKERVVRREPLGEGFGAAAEANTKNPEWYRENIRVLRQTLRSLYDALAAPVAKELGEGETLLVLPYGQLCYLPFESLVNEVSGGESRFWGQERRIAYLTSEPHLQAVLRDMERPLENAADCWVAFADPRGRLGSAMEEAQEIAALFPTSEVHSKQTGNATKAEVYTLRPDCTILHFATHGWLNSGNPNQTFLEMGVPADGPTTIDLQVGDATVKLESDGALTQLEIYPRLRKLVQSFRQKRMRLVTLSACETARAQESPEAEVLGLPDAFALAGASAVLASQWSVETYSTTDLMIEFYRLYAKEKRARADALFLAKKALMQNTDGRYAHPYFWAPFVLYGDWR